MHITDSILISMDTDAKWLAWFEQQFIKYADEDRQISLNNFKKAFNMVNMLYTLFLVGILIVF